MAVETVISKFNGIWCLDEMITVKRAHLNTYDKFELKGKRVLDLYPPKPAGHVPHRSGLTDPYQPQLNNHYGRCAEVVEIDLEWMKLCS
ncbi:hypothetical protein U1Q18_018149, partial [Sarracenia purpurea var. burkii]